MGGTGEGTAGAEAEVGAPTGIGAMKSALMGAVVLAESTMKGIITMRVRVGGTKAKALAVGEDEAEAEAGAPLGKAVRRDVPKLSSGIGKGDNSKRMLVRLMMMEIMTVVIMDIWRMATSTSSIHGKDIISDLFSCILVRFLSFCDFDILLFASLGES